MAWLGNTFDTQKTPPKKNLFPIEDRTDWMRELKSLPLEQLSSVHRTPRVRWLKVPCVKGSSGVARRELVPTSFTRTPSGHPLPLLLKWWKSWQCKKIVDLYEKQHYGPG